ncbi:Thg1 C terminal domain-containing protein [Umbelopsis sp. AD052]|nr:Thg1 C terminal domain-containing protein [Umbelopsis sp. AD052]
MAKSRYEYVKQFELDDSALPGTWMVVRIDGRGFHGFTDMHKFEKPNDLRAIHLMNRAALEVVRNIRDIIIAYGQSDEYSFVLPASSTLYSRRISKITSTIVSLFASNYTMHWAEYFPDTKLLVPPCFDARLVCYPTQKTLRDYLSWRQADCHINNLYNTSFWAIVHSGKTEQEAEERLRGTFSKDKNEILFSDFNINYNTLEAVYRKGSVIIRQETEVKSVSQKSGEEVVRLRRLPAVLHDDIIGNEFWKEHPELLVSSQEYE